MCSKTPTQPKAGRQTCTCLCAAVRERESERREDRDGGDGEVRRGREERCERQAERERE